MSNSFQVIGHENNHKEEAGDMANKQILVIEDDHDIAALNKIHLSEVCQQVRLIHDGQQGLQLALSQSWDTIVLDLKLPGMDGLEICRQVRAQSSYVPILMLTAKSTELDRVLGLELGADDYLTKPFSVLELTARVKALMRRFDASQGLHQPPSPVIACNGLEISSDQRAVKVNGEEISLTAKEFDLLYFFASHPDKVFNRSQLLDQVWGYGHDGYEHTVNSHMNRLRTKIESDAHNPQFIKTIWGVGYKFVATSSSAQPAQS